MFDDSTELDHLIMKSKSLEAQLEESCQSYIECKSQIAVLKTKINSLEMRNQELLEVVRKLAFVLEETSNHA